MKEVILWIFILLPVLYLLLIWDKLPETVPTHFNLQGEADDWSDKSALIWLTCILSLPIYVIMLIIPRIDPKNKIEQMGGKFYTIRLILTIFMSALGIYIINASYTGNMTGMNYLLMIIGAFFAVIGNYMPAMRPNYFIGIRTPWTLENEAVWKNTHRLGGRIWLIGGILIFLLALFIHDEKTIGIVFISMIFVLAGIPILYSYFEYKKLKAKSSE